MATKKPTISVRLDELEKKRVEMAARISNQSAGAFLGSAGQDRARRVLLEWAVERHRSGDASFSELSADTGLAVEEIMQTMGARDRQRALDTFLSSCRTIAEINGDPDFLRIAETAVTTVRRAREAEESPAGTKP